MTEKISCIIPAYNEAPRIQRVLDALTNHPLIAETIVVDDGSTDGTHRVVRRTPSVKLIRLKRNYGKAYAVKKGLECARSRIVMLLDADLINLKQKNVTELAMPVIRGEVDVTISLLKYVFPVNLICRLVYLDLVSGGRCFPKKIFKNLPLTTRTRYGLEVLMNDYMLKHRLHFAVVNFGNVSFDLKNAKEGTWLALRDDLRQTIQIFRAVPAHRAAVQWVTMIRRRKIYGKQRQSFFFQSRTKKRLSALLQKRSLTEFKREFSKRKLLLRFTRGRKKQIAHAKKAQNKPLPLRRTTHRRSRHPSAVQKKV